MSEHLLNRIIRRMPKIELHCHLEGALPLSALHQLLAKYGELHKYRTPESLKKIYHFKDFNDFIATWVWQLGFLRDYDDFYLLGKSVAQSLVEQNIIYAECFYSPGPFLKKGFDLKKLTEAIMLGANEYSTSLKMHLICDIVRNHGPSDGLSLVTELAAVKHLGVIGVGLGGQEQGFPARDFKEVFLKARELGFKTTAHAGETVGAESIIETINALQVSRIGHGITSVDSPEALKLLKDKNIYLEVCPTSNLKTGVCREWRTHPLGALFKMDMPVILGSDDPAFFQSNLENEFLNTMKYLGFRIEDLYKLGRNAINAAWCDESLKKILRLKLETWHQTNSNKLNATSIF